MRLGLASELNLRLGCSLVSCTSPGCSLSPPYSTSLIHPTLSPTLRIRPSFVDPKTGRMPFKGLSDCAMQIVSKEGPVALWTGFGAYYARCAPHAMVILLTVDEVKRVYSKFFNI